MSHVYVLALTSHHRPPITIDGHRIEFISVENVFAAIERRAAPPTLSEAELRSQHDLVTTIFNQMDELLPVRFGAWIDKQELSTVLARQHTDIVEALGLVRGRVQMTIRFLGRPLPARADQLSSHHSETGTAYLQSRRHTEQWMPAEATALTAAVRDLIAAERLSPGSQGRVGSLDSGRLQQIPALYHLISRESVTAYTTATLPFRSPTITVSGPWPPFAFAPDPWL